MPLEQLLDWRAYMLCQPIEPARDDMRAGLIAATVASAAGFKNQDKEPPNHLDMCKTPVQAIIDKEQEPERLMRALKGVGKKFFGALGEWKL